MKSYVLSIDQGTTGSTALLTDATSFEVIGKCNHEFRQVFPSPGLVEHNLEDIWDSIKKSILDVLAETKVNSSQIKSIGITNQRETTCAFTKDGTPLANAIVWQDRRTKNYCFENAKPYESLKSKTGLPLDSYFSATKMKWLLENNDDVKAAALSDNLLLSTIDSFILYRLTGSKSFCTEASNASRTLLMDLESTSWDQELLDFFEIDPKFLPQICDSFTNFGETKELSFLPDGISINCILGDQQAALFGQGGHSKGDLKCTFGTGAFILLNTGSDIIMSKNSLLTTVAFKYRGEATYALEGSTYIAGAAVQWLRDNLKLFKESSDIENIAKSAKGEKMEDIFFFPFFTGIGSPYWNSDATASILGLTRGTTDAEVARAALEGIALSINDSIVALSSDVNFDLDEIFVDGGASLNNFLMQLQSNFSNCKISRPEVIETTAYGVAIGALLGLGSISFSDIKKLRKTDRTFSPVSSDYFKIKKEKWTQLINKIY